MSCSSKPRINLTIGPNATFSLEPPSTPEERVSVRIEAVFKVSHPDDYRLVERSVLHALDALIEYSPSVGEPTAVITVRALEKIQ